MGDRGTQKSASHPAGLSPKQRPPGKPGNSFCRCPHLRAGSFPRSPLPQHLRNQQKTPESLSFSGKTPLLTLAFQPVPEPSGKSKR